MTACALSDSMWWLPWLAIIVGMIVAGYFGYVIGSDAKSEKEA